MSPTSSLASAVPARVSAADLLGQLGARLASTAGGRTALITIALSPVDRALAVGLGDAEPTVLGEVAARVASVLRDGDRFAFASREELWVMIASLPSEVLAELAGRTLLDRLRRPIPTPGNEATAVRLHPAIGVAWALTGTGVDPQSMLAAASGALTLHCDASEQRIAPREVRAPANNLPSQRQLAGELARALNDNAFELLFQPQVELRSGACRSAEALLRWRHPEGGAVSPEIIVETCERCGLIMQLTRFTLNTTLRQMAQWDAEGLAMRVAVNLSATTLTDTSLPLMVSQALQTWDIAPERLTIELTESALVQNQDVARELMQGLHDLGCPLSIDDFGTGYSPYTYLRQFSFDELKIDRAFVQQITTGKADLDIVKSLIDLAHAFGMQAVAEGVEDAATLALLRELGCDFAQGWHLSQALQPDEFAAWCATRGAASCVETADHA